MSVRGRRKSMCWECLQLADAPAIGNPGPELSSFLPSCPQLASNNPVNPRNCTHPALLPDLQTTYCDLGSLNMVFIQHANHSSVFCAVCKSDKRTLCFHLLIVSSCLANLLPTRAPKVPDILAETFRHRPQRSLYSLRPRSLHKKAAGARLVLLLAENLRWAWAVLVASAAAFAIPW